MKDRKYFPIVQDNRGLTLIELIIAMAISSIVIGMVILIIAAGSRNFNIAQNEVDIQMEAQTVVNQMEDTIIEAYWIEQKSISVDVAAYIIYAGQENSNSAIFYDKSQQMLYFVDGLSTLQIRDLSLSSYTKASNLMASDVTAFSLNTDSSALVANQETQLQITLANSSSKFTVDRTIAFRNQAAPALVPTPTPVPGGI